MARIAFDNTTLESGPATILAALKNMEDQEAVIDFLEGLFNDDDFDDDERLMLVPYFIESAREGVKAKKELLEVYAKMQCDEIEAREKSKQGLLGITVRNIAMRIICRNPSIYRSALLKLIPKELLDTELSDENLHEIGTRVDEIRFQKEDKLLEILHVAISDKEREQLQQLLNNPQISLPGKDTKTRKALIQKIKFLNNVAQTIIHQ